MVTENNADGKSTTPPYLPFKTLKRLLESFKDKAAPLRIDSSVLGSFSGSDRAALLPALRFLSLIDKDHHKTTILDELVSSIGNEIEWKKALKSIITDSYADTIGSLDISSASRKQLEERFENASDSRAVVDKCVRFYIAAAVEAGIPLSSFIIERQKTKGERRAPKTKQQRETGGETPNKPTGNATATPETPAGYKEFSLRIKGQQPVRVWVVEGIKEDDWNLAYKQFSLIDMMVRLDFGFDAAKQ